MKAKKDTWRFWRVVWIAMALPFAFAILDLIGAAMWRSVGPDSNAYYLAESHYMLLFWSFAYLLIALIAIIYYIATKDKSETLALAIIPFVLLQMGAEDVFYYFLGGHDLWNATLPWLTNNIMIPTWISQLFGEPIITGPIILLTATIGYGASYIIARQLAKVKG